MNNKRTSFSPISRRSMLKHAGIGAVGLSTLNLFGASKLIGAAAASPPPPRSDIAPLNRFPRMVHEHLARRLRAVEAAAEERRAALRSRNDAEAYVRDVRQRIQRCFGPWPEKTPLNPRVTGVLDRDVYRIEKVIFESRPGFLVTASLYIPKGRKFPLPGVVGSCGHSTTGKAADTYQSFAQGLARQGYVVLLFDPLGQGERLQYMNAGFTPRRGLGGVGEHTHAGTQQFLVDEFLGSWRAWDGIRALDYLLTRPEVDPRHIGITGQSGGGTMTTWLCGLDTRWTMAAPSCFVTTFRRNFENERPADPEQCPPFALALGLDHADFIAALAPKPVILLGQEKDYFDARGLEESFARLQGLYRLLGAEQNIRLFIGSDYHGYSQPNREAMYQWFNHVTGISEAKSEPAINLENPETLWCAPHGQVVELEARTVFSFTRERSRVLREQRAPIGGDALKTAVRAALNLPRRNGVPEYRILRALVSRGHPKSHAGVYAVETEPDIFALVYRLDDAPLLSRPPRNVRRALLYVSHHSADDELRGDPWIAELMRANPEAALFACDVRGIGESKPNATDRSAYVAHGGDYFHAIHGIMLGTPSVGGRTHDVLRVIDWLGANSHEEVHLAAKGWGAIPGAFAALLADRVTEVTLKYALTSYADIAETEEYDWPLATLLPGVLKTFDLPDCYRALATKKLRLIESWNASGGRA